MERPAPVARMLSISPTQIDGLPDINALAIEDQRVEIAIAGRVFLPRHLQRVVEKPRMSTRERRDATDNHATSQLSGTSFLKIFSMTASLFFASASALMTRMAVMPGTLANFIETKRITLRSFGQVICFSV